MQSTAGTSFDNTQSSQSVEFLSTESSVDTLKLEETTLTVADISVIVIYFVAVLIVGLWSSKVNRGSVSGYFLAGRSMHWIPAGASVFASNIGSVHFVGIVGSGASGGIAVALYEIVAVFSIIALGWVFIPVYVSSGVYTMPEYLKRRFGGKRIRIHLSLLSLLLYIFTKISVDLFSGALFIQQAMKWDIYIAIAILLTIAAVFTITGGLTAVVWTDFFQTIIMCVGALTLMAFGFIKVGGYEGIRDKYPLAISKDSLYRNDSCGMPRPDYLKMLRDPSNADIPWPGGVFGITVIAIWYFCTDQVIVQRLLAVKSYSFVKLSCILASFLKLLPLFMLVFPGMIARILYKDIVGCVDPETCRKMCGNKHGCADIAYPLLVMRLLPSGLRGCMLAVMLSALMSSMTSIFNSSSTIFTMDIWRQIRKSASQAELMIVGRIFVVVMVILSILWVPVIQATQGMQIFAYLNAIASYLVPPIAAVFVSAVFIDRVNEKGAFWSMMIGLVVGFIRFVLEFTYGTPSCISTEPDVRPSVVKRVHFLHFAILLFFVVFFSSIIISLLTKPLADSYTRRLTFKRRNDPVSIKDEDINGEPEQIQIDSLDEKTEPQIAEPKWKQIGRWLCGIEKRNSEESINNKTEQDTKAIKSLKETKASFIISTLLATLVISLATFNIFFFI